jgi:hypothetical protein
MYYYTVSMVDEWMSMEHWQNDTGKGTVTYLEKNPVPVSLCPPHIPQGQTYIFQATPINYEGNFVQYSYRVWYTHETTCSYAN